MLLSVERPFVGAFAVRIPGATLLHRNGLVRAVLPASIEHGERTLGVLQEPGRSCRILGEIPAGDTGLTTPGLDGALVRRGAKRTSERGGTAKRRKRSAAGWAAGSRNALIVTLKQGILLQRTLRREAKRQSTGSTEGNTLNTSRFSRMSTELGRIATGTLQGWRLCRRRNRMLSCEQVQVCGSPGRYPPGPRHPQGGRCSASCSARGPMRSGGAEPTWTGVTNLMVTERKRQ